MFSFWYRHSIQNWVNINYLALNSIINRKKITLHILFPEFNSSNNNLYNSVRRTFFGPVFVDEKTGKFLENCAPTCLPFDLVVEVLPTRYVWLKRQILLIDRDIILTIQLWLAFVSFNYINNNLTDTIHE